MQTLEQDMIAWELHKETKDWHQRQFRAWRRDTRLREKYPDFYTYLKGRRRYEVEEQKKRAGQQNYVTVKEAEMSTGKPISEEQRQAMEQIERWKTNNPVPGGTTPKSDSQTLAASHPDFPEWLNLSDPVRAACDYDFLRFVSTKERGMLPDLKASCGAEIARQLRRKVHDRQRRDLADSIAEARKDPRWEAIAERAKLTGNYPDLKA